MFRSTAISASPTAPPRFLVKGKPVYENDYHGEKPGMVRYCTVLPYHVIPLINWLSELQEAVLNPVHRYGRGDRY